MAPRVLYYYHNDIGNFHFGPGHPMKPHRVKMTHSLLASYGLLKHMRRLRPEHPVAVTDLCKFHSDDYIKFLEEIRTDNVQNYLRQLWKYNVGKECPVFDGIIEYCQLYTTGSVAGAKAINNDEADIVINWAGGMNLPRKDKAMGFAYVNDCVLAILELLKKHPRVLYISMDANHALGVEEAFYSTNRVLTLSFHHYGPNVYPGTGHIDDHGAGLGTGFALNCPLEDYATDDSFLYVFRPLVEAVMKRYQPTAMVVQCGANTVAGDRLCSLNLSSTGQSTALSYLRSFSLPLLVLGGGGSTLRNVARCWTANTAALLDMDLKDTNIPEDHLYREYYAPDYLLSVQSQETLLDCNTVGTLQKILATLLRKLRMGQSSPRVPKHMLTYPVSNTNASTVPGLSGNPALTTSYTGSLAHGKGSFGGTAGMGTSVSVASGGRGGGGGKGSGNRANAGGGGGAGTGKTTKKGQAKGRGAGKTKTTASYASSKSKSVSKAKSSTMTIGKHKLSTVKNIGKLKSV